MNEFSSLKPAWHLNRILQLREKQDIVPTHLQLIISDLCNQDCGFCAYRMDQGFSTEQFKGPEGEKNPKRFIPLEKIKEILFDCQMMGCKAIEFTGGGEPTVHPEWREALEFAFEHNLQCGLVTNGTRLRKDDRELLEQLKWLRISLDAGTRVTYETTRRSRLWQKALDSIAFAASLHGPYVGVGFVVTQENFSELVEACKLVKSYGVPYIRISAMFSNLGAEYYAGIYDSIRAQIEEAKTLQNERFKVVDFFGARVQDLELAAPNYSFCGYQQFVVYIGGNQKVYTCCTNAYTKKGEIGDLREMSFNDWVHERRQIAFDARQCHHCQFNDKNRVIDYLVRPDPPHVNFV